MGQKWNSAGIPMEKQGGGCIMLRGSFPFRRNRELVGGRICVKVTVTDAHHLYLTEFEIIKSGKNIQSLDLKSSIILKTQQCF